MTINYFALQAECANLVGKSPFNKHDPVDAPTAQSIVQRCVEVALKYSDYLVTVDRDPNLLIDAIKYLGQAHLIPHAQSVPGWLETALEVLIEIAAPNSGITEEQGTFVKELKKGVDFLSHHIETSR